MKVQIRVQVEYKADISSFVMWPNSNENSMQWAISGSHTGGKQAIMQTDLQTCLSKELLLSGTFHVRSNSV